MAYYPKVLHPNASNNIPPLKSGGFQPPFFFGGSQIPEALSLEHKPKTGRGIKRKLEFISQNEGKKNQFCLKDRTDNIQIPRYMKIQ